MNNKLYLIAFSTILLSCNNISFSKKTLANNKLYILDVSSKSRHVGSIPIRTSSVTETCLNFINDSQVELYTTAYYGMFAKSKGFPSTTSVIKYSYTFDNDSLIIINLGYMGKLKQLHDGYTNEDGEMFYSTSMLQNNKQEKLNRLNQNLIGSYYENRGEKLLDDEAVFTVIRVK